MNNKTNLSSFARVKENLVSLRKKYGIMRQYSMDDIARNAGLPVEYLENIPTSFEGFLDMKLNPRFIVVNPNLPAHDQALSMARQLATCAHQRRCNSLALDRPWKWEMFDAAPAELKQKISELDIEHRAHWLMLFFTTGDEFRAFIKADPKRFWANSFTSNIVWYHLSKLRVKLWLGKICRKITSPFFPA
jgi:hypothetical protein